MLSASPQLLAHLRQWEAFRAHAYLDEVAQPAVWTIGYGETAGVKEGDVTTETEAALRLNTRVSRDFAPAVWDALPGFRERMFANEFDALIGLAYNIGTGAFHTSTLAAMLNRGERAQLAAEEFAVWNHSGGVEVRNLTKRRAREMRVFLSGW